MTRVRRSRSVGALFAGLAVLLTGCNVAARVEVAVKADGSGTLRTTITLDADAVQRMGGPASLARNVPLGDLRGAGWSVSPWTHAADGSATLTVAHPFADQADLARRVVDLAGPHGILQDPKITRTRGWFNSRDALSLVVDVRSPTVDIVHDAPLAARLRAAGVDPATLEAQLAVQLRRALHLTVVVKLPDGRTQSYDAATGSVKTLSVADGGLDWDHVVKFGIGVTLLLLAGLFFTAAGVGIRRNRHRIVQRAERRRVEPELTEREA